MWMSRKNDELDFVQRDSVIPGEGGIMSKHGKGFLFPSPFAKKNLYHVLWCDEYFCTPNYKVDRERLSCFLLMYLMSGEMSVTTNKKTYDLSGGSLILMDLNMPHSYRAKTNVQMQQYMVNGNVLPSYYKLLTENKRQGLVVQQDSRISFLMTSLKNETMTGLPNDHIINMLITEILTLMANAMTVTTSDPIRQAKFYMASHYNENISLDDIAGAVSLSKYYFSRLFEKETGYTPWEYLTEIRMRNAMHVLTHTGASIERIAESCAFCNATHFIRAFKSFTGFTPGVFRRYFSEVPMGIGTIDP